MSKNMSILNVNNMLKVIYLMCMYCSNNVQMKNADNI